MLANVLPAAGTTSLRSWLRKERGAGIVTGGMALHGFLAFCFPIEPLSSEPIPPLP
jgi:hypothetical protein